MDVEDEIRTLRARVEALERRLDALDRDSAGAVPAILVRYAEEADYPSGDGKVYAARPVRISGEQVEGAVPTLTAVTDSFVHVARLSGGTPAEGSYALAEASADWWVDCA